MWGSDCNSQAGPPSRIRHGAVRGNSRRADAESDARCDLFALGCLLLPNRPMTVLGRHRAEWIGALSILAVVGFFAWRQFAREDVMPPPDPPAATAKSMGLAEDEAWCSKVRTMASTHQWNAIVDKIVELNPGYQKELAAGWIEPEAVLRFTVRTNVVDNISPLRCFSDLKFLSLRGTKPGLGKLTSVAPIQGMRLHTLGVPRNPRLTDLPPLRGMPLNTRDITDTGVKRSRRRGRRRQIATKGHTAKLFCVLHGCERNFCAPRSSQRTRRQRMICYFAAKTSFRTAAREATDFLAVNTGQSALRSTSSGPCA